MKTSRKWMGLAVAVTAGFLLAGGAPTAWGAAYSWDGNGNANNDGFWTDTTKWNADGQPSSTDDVTLPDVTTGTRTITYDGTGGSSPYRGAKTLTFIQTTANATNKLLLAANRVGSGSGNGAFSWAVNGLTLNLNPAGTIVIDKGSYNFQPWFASSAPQLATLGANVIVNSTGGTMGDMWDGSRTQLKFQGTLNLSNNFTTFAPGGEMTLDTTGVMNLTSGGAASVGNTGTLTVKGTVNGNSTSYLLARTVILDTSSAVPSSIGSIRADNLSIRSATPGNFDLSGTTLYRNKIDQLASLEAAASGAGANFKIGTLSFVNPGGAAQNTVRTRLVNDYANSGNQASEYFLVGTLNATGSFIQELDLNGQRLVIDGGVANYVNTGNGGFYLSNRSSGHGYFEFRTTGGALNLNNTYVGVSGGGTLEIIGPASITNGRLYNPGTALGSAGGTIAFNGNFSTADGTAVSFSDANSTTTLDLSGNTFTLSMNVTQGRISVSSNATFIVKGNVTGGYYDSGNGLLALGTTKSGAGTPVITPSGTIIVSGNVSSSGNGLSMQIGRDATFKVGGNFSPTWGGGIAGAAYRSFFADTSTNAGSFIFNGGGSSVQTMEVLSRGYTVITGLSYFQASGTAPAASQTVTGASSGATATINYINGDILQLTSVSGTFQADETLTFSGGGTARAYDTQFTGLDGQTSGSIPHLPIGTLSIGDPAGTNASVKLVNSYNPWGGAAENTQAARSLTVTTNSTFDLASFEMVVAAGTNSTVAGLVTNSVAGGTLTLANSATLKFATGGVIDVDTLTINTGCTVDFNKAQGSYIRVNGDEKDALDALIAGGQIVDNGGGVVKTSYSAGDAHTTVYLAPPPSGSVLIIE